MQLWHFLNFSTNLLLFYFLAFSSSSTITAVVAAALVTRVHTHTNHRVVVASVTKSTTPPTTTPPTTVTTTTTTALYAMNYAEDRIDRRARYDHDNHDNGLIQDWYTAYQIIHDPHNNTSKSVAEGHELLGRTLRDMGWCQHALFHYAMAWVHQPHSSQAVGDYAQMCEFAGYPEYGVLALLHYRQKGELQSAEKFQRRTMDMDDNRNKNNNPNTTTTTTPREKRNTTVHIPTMESLVEKLHEDPLREGHDCGCGFPSCGSSTPPIPMIDMDKLWDALEVYQHGVKDRISHMPSANTILSNLAKNERMIKCQRDADIIDMEELCSVSQIPSILQFWKTTTTSTTFMGSKTLPNTGTSTTPTTMFRPLEPVLQMLLLKLLYVTLPSLAIEGMLHSTTLESSSKEMAILYKSHHAYYVLLRAVIFGERMKPHRRLTVQHYHVPVWDLVWDQDQRRIGQGQPIQTQIQINQAHTTESSGHYCNFMTKPTPPNIKVSSPESIPSMVSATTTASSSAGATTLKPLYVMGDSHVMSIAWQTIAIPSIQTSSSLLGDDLQTPPSLSSLRMAVPLVVTGMKAWHTRPKTRFFTHYNLHASLQRLPPTCQTILFSAGEIDCREGIGGTQLEGYTELCWDKLTNTVCEYVKALVSLSAQYNDLQILVLPVAPHAHRSGRNGKVRGRTMRRQTMQHWNHVMQEQLGPQQQQQQSPRSHHVFFLNYVPNLQASHAEEYVLDPAFNADYTHMNSAFLPSLEEALRECGCDLSRL